MLPLFMWIFVWITPDNHVRLWAYTTREACEQSRAHTLPGAINPYAVNECVRTPLYTQPGTPQA